MFPTEAKIEWKRVPSNHLSEHSHHSLREEEKHLLKLLAKTGIVSGGQVQAHGILGQSERKSRSLLNRMFYQKKIIEHKLSTSKKEYKIYTLWPVGAKLVNVPYAPDYWYFYKESEAVQRIMAFDLYLQMCRYFGTDVEIKPGEPPYVYTFSIGVKTYKIGAIWDNLTTFVETYRWNPPEDRVILVCSNLSSISSLIQYFEEHTPIRAATCQDLRQGLVIYKPGKNGWEK